MPSLKPTVNKSDDVSLDDICFLISHDIKKDNIGQTKKNAHKRQIFCSQIGVSRQEFFNAGKTGLKPQIVLLVDSSEYDRETVVIYNNQQFQIYRNYMRNDGYTELYAEVRSNVENKS